MPPRWKCLGLAAGFSRQLQFSTKFAARLAWHFFKQETKTRAMGRRLEIASVQKNKQAAITAKAAGQRGQRSESSLFGFRHEQQWKEFDQISPPYRPTVVAVGELE